MKNLIVVITVFLLLVAETILAQPQWYKGIYLPPNNTPALLKLSDSTLIEIGTNWKNFADTVYTDKYQSTPEGYFIYLNNIPRYATLRNPGRLPVTMWGYGKVKIDFSIFRPHKILVKALLRGWLTVQGKEKFEYQNKTINAITPTIDDSSAKGKIPWWVWNVNNQKGWPTGHLEFH